VRPEHGGRLELKLAASAGPTARYELSISTARGESRCEISIDGANASLQFAAWDGGEPPRWLDTFARSLLRTIARSSGASGDWPRRVTRWRPEPES
jgi:hypothetical protein